MQKLSKLDSAEPVDEIPLAHPEIVRLYQRDVDVTLIKENLKLTPAERLQKLEEFVSFLSELRANRKPPAPNE